MYLRENGYEEYVQKAVCCKSYYVVEEDKAVIALENYRKSVTIYSCFKKAK